MVNTPDNTQNWLNKTILFHQRANITNLLIVPHAFNQASINWAFRPEQTYRDFSVSNHYSLNAGFSLRGNLVLNDFINLKKLDIHYQDITGLDLSNCSNLQEITVDDNKLERLLLPVNSQELTAIRLTNNNIVPQNLSLFTRFVNLKSLLLGTDEDGLSRGKHNRWNGSLSHLQNLNWLLELDINATDIDQGWEILPTDYLYRFTLGDKGRSNARVNTIKQALGFDEATASDDKDDDVNNWKILKIDFNREFNQNARQLQAQIKIPLRRTIY